MSFTLLSPVWLVGLLAAAIPLLIHLSRSRRTKKMRFSTTRFFTDQFLRSYRMSQLKEILLLACRMALFALLSMALAQPLLKPSGEAALGGSGARTVVLVLDDSASMGVIDGGEPLFERARRAALGLVDNLSQGDAVSLVLAARRPAGPEVLFAEPTEDLDEVRRQLRQAKIAPLGTDLSSALAQADLIAAGARAEKNSAAGVYVLSDLQESGWDAGDATSRGDAADTAYFFVSCRPRKTPANRAVAAVRYAATRPRPGVPFALRPLLSLGIDDGQEVPVRLVIDGAKVGEQKAERLPGGKWASPRFYHTFDGPGWHAGHVETDDAVLAADNRRYFAIEVPATTETVPVLAVNGAPSSVAAQDELFFLRFALTAAPEGQKAPFALSAIAPAEVAAQKLDSYPLIVLANVEKLSDAAVEKLEQYVDEGGKLLVFLGDKTDLRFCNDVLAGPSRRNGGLLPARLKPTKEAGKPDPLVFIGQLDYEHRALAAFQEPRLGTLLGPSLAFNGFALDAPPNAVLMKASKGSPLLCEKAFGKGKVMLFASTCDRDWSDFPVRPGFLLWSRFVAEYLTQTPLSLQSGFSTGEVVRLPGGGEPSLWVRKPDGTIEAASRARDGSGAFDYLGVDAPGVYAVVSRKGDDETRVGLFAVNLDPHESDLSYLDDAASDETPEALKKRVEADLKERLGGAPLVRYVADPAEATATLGGSGRGWKLWNALLVLVLLVGLFEPWLANQISGRLYARRKEEANR
ncbi:MAG: BatA domain-containing protein [Gemmataceae bacterium]|nr:BatA domain-containing protein [Gemmataceae bacterium]